MNIVKRLIKKKKIEKWLNKYNIKNYELIEDDEYGYVVNVNGNVNLDNINLKKIEVDFHKINGSFNISKNNLKTLIGSPKIINGNFHCSNNQLESLKGCPEIVNGGFFCYNNNIDIEGLILMNALQVNGTKIDFTNNEKLKEIQNINNFNELKKIINIYNEKIKILNIIENKENQLINLNKKIIKI